MTNMLNTTNTMNYLLKIPAEAVFVMILIVSANFLAETFPCKIQSLLHNSMLTKHFFGFMTMMFFVVIALPNASTNVLTIFFQSVMLYIIFICVSKTHSSVFILLMFAFGIQYILDLIRKDLKSKNNEQLKNKIKYIDTITFIFKIFSFVLIIFGLLAYMGEKKLEYTKNFRYDFFFLGKPKCRGITSKSNILNSFINSFN